MKSEGFCKIIANECEILTSVAGYKKIQGYRNQEKYPFYIEK